MRLLNASLLANRALLSGIAKQRPRPTSHGNIAPQTSPISFWGHYLNSKEAAYEDYRGRINAEIEYVAERTHKPPLLPLFCYSLMPSSGELIRIERGCKGYEQVPYGSTGDPAVNRKTADSRNREMGVTRAQEEAMLAGSLFGWHTKAADPRSYDENGQPKRVKKRDELER